jgi:hypothetical protein
MTLSILDISIFSRFLKLHIAFLPFLIVFCACNKLTEVNPPITALTSDNVYQNDATANSVLLGLFGSIGNNSPIRGQSINSISLVAGLSADELTLYGGSANANANLAGFYLNKLTSGSPVSSESSIWNEFYNKIYGTNLAIERISNANKLTPVVKQQLLGEAKFLRAFFYFNLVNLYGNVPLALTSDYRTNSTLSRALKSDVYKQIVADLKDAKNLLTESYVDADGKTLTTEKLRPNKYVATTLLARTYLYMGDVVDAENQASQVINSTKYKLGDLNNVFLKNSDEAIWQLQPVNFGWNTEDARVFILPATGPTSNSSVTGYPVYLSKELLNSFESNDVRSLLWIGNVTVANSADTIKYYYSYKYKNAKLGAIVTEYEMVFRLAELFLIRAEARAVQNNIGGSQDDLNAIRIRAGIGKTNANDKSSLLTAIMHERQVELFTEWGHRWLDLKRTGIIDPVMAQVIQEKGTTWNTNWQLYPIPFYDLTQNGNLVQNTGY